MRVVSVAASVFVFALAASAATAETWVHTRDNGGGYPMCFDKDSPKLGADNLTHYAVKMCQDQTPQWYAVDCNANFKVDLVIRVFNRRNPSSYVDMVVNDPQSGMMVDAVMACRK